MTATLDGPATAVSVGELRSTALAGGAAPAELGGRCRRIVDGTIDDAGNLALSVELADSAAAGAVLVIPSGTAVGSALPADGSAPLASGATPPASRDGGAAGNRTSRPVPGLGPAPGRPVTAGAAEVVALVGDVAPGGGRYRAFREVDLADGGHLLFRAELAGCAASEGLFLRTRTGVHAVARAGENGTPAYASFAQPTVIDGGGTPSLAFVATLADGRSCVVQQPSYEQPALALCTGTPLGDEVIKDNLVISRLGMGLCCVARVWRGDRHLTKALIVTSSVVSSGDWVQTGARLGDHGRISRLLTPPTVCAQLGFVTVGFDDGRMALCTRPPALAEPAVVLTSGDPVPGLDGETVHRIGAPVASSSAAMQVPFGVACPIRLRSGRAALWVGVFGGQLPLEGAAIVPWVDGERTVDRPELPVGRLSPVKFGNDGTLLLRAVLGNASERRSSLVALPGLFDWYGASDSPPGNA